MKTVREVFDQICLEFDPQLARYVDDLLIDGGHHALLYSDEEERAMRAILMRDLRELIAAKRFENKPLALRNRTKAAGPNFDAFLGVLGKTK